MKKLTAKQTNALSLVLKRSGWNKYGGYANKYFAELYILLRDAGFKKKKYNASHNPDGSTMSRDEYWVHPIGLIAYICDHIGSTKYDNRYSFGVEVKEKKTF